MRACWVRNARADGEIAVAIINHTRWHTQHSRKKACRGQQRQEQTSALLCAPQIVQCNHFVCGSQISVPFDRHLNNAIFDIGEDGRLVHVEDLVQPDVLRQVGRRAAAANTHPANTNYEGFCDRTVPAVSLLHRPQSISSQPIVNSHPMLLFLSLAEASRRSVTRLGQSLEG